MDVPLGTIVLPSGLLVVGDMGYLGMWSGDRRPEPPEEWGERVRERAAAARDMRFTGPDAEAAARAFGRQSQTYLYDVPPQEMRRLYGETVGADAFDARLEEEPARVPHAERARRAAGGHDFLVHGVPFVALGGLPVNEPLRLSGRELERGVWESVTLQIRPDAAVASTAEIGQVGVDWARLIFADLVCLAAWEHEEALDGLADVAFWGLHEEKVARKFSAPKLPEGASGWENLPLEEAADRAVEIDEWAKGRRKPVAVDFRPHSHHHHVMRGIRAAEHEAGELELAGGRVLGLMTSVGDGVFPVELDRDAAGAPVALRVMLAE